MASNKTGLSGVNRLCRLCTQKCKQLEQVKVIFCPFFKDNRKMDAKLQEWGGQRA